MKTLTFCLTFVVAQAAAAQAPASVRPPPTGWEITGIPALNYDADEGFGYGALLQLYNYGAKGRLPYVFTIQPTVFLTTGGRRDYTLFVDAPGVGGSKWRVDGYFGHETQKAAPYYGIGNASVHDESLEVEPNEKYYRFVRERVQFTTNAQRRVGTTPLRVLVGAGIARVRIDNVPSGNSTTYLNEELGAAAPEGSSNYVRAGVVWDTRDRETHTSRGTWADALVQRVDKKLGSDWNFTRVTVTVRQYAPISRRVTFAQRVLVQNVSGDAPFYELSVVQTSFKPQQGLGGSNTVRGIPLNRFVGKGLTVVNNELRWRAAEFGLLHKPSTLTLTGFFDAGRVWAGEVKGSELASGLHAGYGAGARVGRGPNFVVSLDVGHSKESAAAVYIGLGFLF